MYKINVTRTNLAWIGADIETYSPEKTPWTNGYADPVVSVAFAVIEDLKDIESLSIFSFIKPPRYEPSLLYQVIRFLEVSRGIIVWYYGYGPRKFDVPYLLKRAEKYGLRRRLENAIEAHVNLDVCDLAKQALGLGTEYRLSMTECNQRLGISRTLQKSSLNGANYHIQFDEWECNGSLKALFYNEEDAINNLRILQKLIRLNPLLLGRTVLKELKTEDPTFGEWHKTFNRGGFKYG